MASNTELRDFLFRVKNVIAAVEESTGFDTLDPTSKNILEYVARAELEDREIYVADVIRHRDLGSVANLHGRLSTLVHLGWLTLLPEPTDGRRKRVILAQPARSAYNKMSSKLENALKPKD